MMAAAQDVVQVPTVLDVDAARGMQRRYQRYEKQDILGEGTYGTVWSATDRETGKTVAVKKVRLGARDEGLVPAAALREIKLMRELHHPNIVDLLDVVPFRDNVNLVFELMHTDLEAVINDRSIILGPADIKSVMKMTLLGLAECHRNWILHRDLKPGNLMIAADGTIKLGDFGLGRRFGEDRNMSAQVVTRWYRAPELLFGARHYGVGVDMWAIGCIFAELMLRGPYLPGNSDLDQLARIFAALGTPTEEDWPGVTSLPDYIPFQPSQGTPFRAIFTAASDDALDLMAGFFRWNPAERWTAAQALDHAYFTSGPAPTPPSQLPLPRSASSS